MVRVGFLASGEGTTMQAVIDACATGQLQAIPTILIHNNSAAGCVDRARAAGMATCHLSGVTHPDARQLDEAILSTLLEHDVDVVVLAGYMKKLGPMTLARFRTRIVNTHPGLLPAFGGQGMYGMRVHAAVIDAGASETGATVHLVDEHYDHGTVIAEQRIPVAPDDTPESLDHRVRPLERKLLVDALQQFATRSGPLTD